MSGLAGTGLSIADASAGQLAVPGNGTFALPNPIATGSSYSVSITTQPTKPVQACTIAGASGNVAAGNVTSVEITCGLPEFPIAGTVIGLTGSSFTIADNVGDGLTISGNGPFVLATPIASGAEFRLSVVSQPTTPNQLCVAANASGTIGTTSPQVTITCSGTTLTSRLIDLASDELGAVVPDLVRHRIYVAAPYRNELIVLDADTYLVLDHFFVGSWPKAMALSADGSSLYIGLHLGGALAVVNLSTYLVSMVPVATQMGTSAINAVTEVHPGVVLVGGSGFGVGPTAQSGAGNVISVDLTNGAAIKVVAAGLGLASVNTLTKSLEGRVVYGLGTGFPVGPGAGATFMFSLDATQTALPVVATRTPLPASGLAVSADSKRLVTDQGGVYDAMTLTTIDPGTANPGVVGETADGSVILQTTAYSSINLRDSTSLSVTTSFTDDCPQQLLSSLTPTGLRDEWIFGVSPYYLCAVSLTNPTVAPGAPGSRALPPWIPAATTGPWADIHDGYVDDAAIDSARGVAYATNGLAKTVDIFSLAQQTVVGSIPVAGVPQAVVLGSDGVMLYVSLSDIGSVVTIDRNTQLVTSSVNLAAILGSPTIFWINEIAPAHVLVGAAPTQGGVGPNTFLVDVDLSNPPSAQRVGCAAGYSGVGMVLSPDHHYLYLVTADTCPPEKRDLTQPGYPVVVSGPAGGYVSLGNIGGMPVVTPDDAHILIGGTLIDTATMQQTANYLGGAALPSANPDRYYLADATGGGSSITTMELHDLKAVSTVINGCLSIGYGVHRATISGDEKIVITIGDGGGICVTQIAQ